MMIVFDKRGLMQIFLFIKIIKNMNSKETKERIFKVFI